MRIVWAIATNTVVACNCLAAPPVCPPPKQEKICVNGQVVRKLLIAEILDACSVPRSLENRLSNTPFNKGEQESKDHGLGLTNAERIFTLPACGGSDSCTSTETDSVIGATMLLARLLGGPGGYTDAYKATPDALSPAQFLENKAASIECLSNSKGKPQEAPGAMADKPVAFIIPLRIRGATDGLFFDKDASQFSSIKKATLSTNYASGNSTKSDKENILIGYPIFGDSYSVFSLIPYVGINRNTSKPSDKPSSTSVFTTNGGLLNAFQYTTKEKYPITHWATVGIDRLTNHLDSSNLVTLAFVYTPIKNYDHDSWWHVNSYNQNAWFNGNASVEPIFDIRSDYGNYIVAGNSSTTDYGNYWRLGSRFGGSITSENTSLPISFTATETYLYGLTGSLSRLSYFTGTLSYKVGGKYISLDLSFTNGRREDTTTPEHNWTIGLSGAY